MAENGKFSASQSLLGYIYQCRLALLETLKRLKTNPRLVVGIETLDDVVFEKNGNPSEIIQVKHHVNREANLTDASTDLWKTIRIWCDLYSEGIIQNGAIFCMMTTAKSAPDSAAYYLRSETRDISEAIKRLTHTAITSANATNKEAYNMLLSLGDEEKQDIFESALIIDRGPSNSDITELLQKEIWPACERGKSEQFLNYLEGWWLRRIVQSLLSSTSRHIIAEEIDACINGLREQFKSDNLPIHEDLKTATADLDLFQNRIFVQQLKLIEIGPKRIAMAVNNYYRAFEQRSRWLREDLLIIGDVETFEKKLIEEWEAHFESLCEELETNATEQEKIKAARNIYKWVEAEADIPIRPQCHETFITRGSYHILADRQEVGWHPEFRLRLANLLQKQETDV